MAEFITTRWSLVLRARDSSPETRRRALTALCESYRLPVYAFIRHTVRRGDRAEDLTQEFFLRILREGALDGVDPALGRFRSFLLGAVKHFLADARDYESALKRGGGEPPIPIDAVAAGTAWRLEPVDSVTPEQLYDRQWARTTLERATARLAGRMEADGRAEEWRWLRPALTGDGHELSYRAIAERMGSSEGAVKVAVHRLRRRFGECLREEIAETVGDAADVEQEIRDLMAALS